MSEAYTAGRGGNRGRRKRTGDVVPGTPAQERELRAQGRKTMSRLLDAGMQAFAEKGYHAARVDDIVRVARTSHGTFYLYFANKEDLLRALATECAQEMDALANQIGPIGHDADGFTELRAFLEQFFATYRRYGPVLRAWMEGHVDDREVSALGVTAFTDIATALGERMRSAGARGDDASIAALMALLERFAYFIVTRRLGAENGDLLDTLTTMVQRGFFTHASASAASGARVRNVR
ncbi:MAG: TetR/AcrR family transcriptional regulator [Acidimicrobiia bacterium]